MRRRGRRAPKGGALDVDLCVKPGSTPLPRLEGALAAGPSRTA